MVALDLIMSIVPAPVVDRVEDGETWNLGLADSLNTDNLEIAHPCQASSLIWWRNFLTSKKMSLFSFSISKQVASNTIASSPLGHKWASLARPFSLKPAGNGVIGIDLGTANSCVAVMEGQGTRSRFTQIPGRGFISGHPC